MDRLRHISSRNTYIANTNLLVSAHKHKQRLVLKQRLKTVSKRINRQRAASKGAQMVSKNMEDMIRDWHKKGYSVREIARVAKLPEDLVKAIVEKPKTAEEWNKKIFSNHH